MFFLVQIIKKECLETFLTQETFSRLQISWYLEVEKFAFVAKGIVHDFYQRKKFLYLHFSRPDWSKRLFGNVPDTKWAFWTKTKLILESCKISLFYKGVSSYFWSKILSLVTLFFSNWNCSKRMFIDVLDTKKPFLDYK